VSRQIYAVPDLCFFIVMVMLQV